MNTARHLDSGGSASPAKRKSDDGAPQPRAKRNRYISIACNECKRRKIKCNGQTPCQRCGNLSLECLYAPNCCNNFKESDEFKQMSAHISSLQEQVDQLFANLNSLRGPVESVSLGSMETPYSVPQYQPSTTLSQTSAVPLSPVRRKSISRHPRFHGPTSSTFNLGVAKTSLQTMGITAPEEAVDEAASPHEATPAGTPVRTPTGTPPMPPAPLPPRKLHPTKDPIWSLTETEGLRLIGAFHDEMGLMYPIMDIDSVTNYAKLLFAFIESATRNGLMQGAYPGSDSIMDEQTTILKLILAIALVTGGCGKSALGQQLFNNVEPIIQKCLLEPVTIKGIHILCLTAMYNFHRDDEALAWRVIGLAARQCLELGLHRHETYNILFTNAEDRAAAVRTFWSVFVLDRRWSFGTGMPFAMQDSDLDPSLPKPDESSPYLTAMISYSKIGSKVWKSIANVDGQNNGINKDISYLDYQIINWQRSIPDSLKFVHPDSGKEAHPPSRAIHRLQVALYLRTNQMRILIYRPVLHTATSIQQNLDKARTVVKIATDTIRILTHINHTTDLYRTQQMMFNYFLISALAVLFLAVAHAPVEFSPICRDEFYMALDLVRGLSANSYVSKRLWKTIKVLKEVGPRLGLNVRAPAVEAADAHSTAVVAMAGLAGHQVDEMAIFSNGRNGILNSPHGMASDLNNLFEAAGGYGTAISNGFPLPSDMPNGELPTFGHDDELSRILNELF